MIEQLDKRILALESELAELRRRKIALLQAQIAEVQATLSGNPSAPSARGTVSGKGSKSGKGWATDLQSSGWSEPAAPRGKSGPKKRGRRPGKRVPDEHVLPTITRLIAASGKEGISARKVSQATGIFYPRVVKLMDANFKKTGERKWSRYHVK